jgi:hypothetical protein
VAERLRVTPDAALMLLRRYARDHNHRLTELAGDVIRGTAPIAGSTPEGTRRGSREQPKR